MREIFQNIAISYWLSQIYYVFVKLNEQNERIENLNAIIAFNAEQINKNFAYIYILTDEILQMKIGMSLTISAEKKIQEESEKINI